VLLAGDRDGCDLTRQAGLGKSAAERFPPDSRIGFPGAGGSRYDMLGAAGSLYLARLGVDHDHFGRLR
jgi:hypothetical protein